MGGNTVSAAGGWGQGSIMKGEALDLMALTFNGELGPS